MSRTSVQIHEAQLHAKMDFECRVRGAQILAYPPVVAGKCNHVSLLSGGNLL